MTAELDVTCYHYEPCMAPLLANAVLPAARAARDRGAHVHIERHWLHGPHLRVRLRAPAPSVESIADGVHAALTAYVAAHPSHARTDPAELLARSEANGRAELIPGPYTPIHPDGTVRIEPAEDSRLSSLLGGDAAVTLRSELFAAGVDALDVAARESTGTSHSARAVTDGGVRVALAAVVAHATHYPTGLADGHHTFLSHVEEFLYLHDPDGSVRAHFDQQWHRHGDRVTAMVKRVVSDGAQTTLDQAWADWTSTAWRLCPPAFDRGDLSTWGGGDQYRLRASAFDVRTAAQWNPTARGYSEYHRRLRHIGFATGNERALTSYRFATNVLYQLLLVCDVTPLQRLLAAHLLAEAAQRLNGRSWREHMPEPAHS